MVYELVLSVFKFINEEKTFIENLKFATEEVYSDVLFLLLFPKHYNLSFPSRKEIFH